MAESGFLTEKQRRFLAGERTDLSDANERMTRSRIKQRTKSAVRDFPFLLFNLDDERFENIVDELQRESLPDEQRVMEETVGRESDQRGIAGELVPLIQFCYRGVGRDTDLLENLIESAIAWSDLHPEHGGRFVVGVDIKTEPSVQSIKEKFDQGKELSDLELALLVRHGHSVDLDYEELQQEMAERH